MPLSVLSSTIMTFRDGNRIRPDTFMSSTTGIILNRSIPDALTVEDLVFCKLKNNFNVACTWRVFELLKFEFSDNVLNEYNFMSIDEINKLIYTIFVHI